MIRTVDIDESQIEQWLKEVDLALENGEFSTLYDASKTDLSYQEFLEQQNKV